VATFSDLFSRLDPDPRVRGKQFEHVCKWFLTNDPTYKNTLRRVWLWSEWTSRWGGDAGIDLVAEDRDGRLWAIQAKAYDPANAVTKADVDKFLSESSRAMFSYRLLIATTDKRHHVARRTMDDQEKKVGFVGLSDLLTSEVDWRINPLDMRPSPPPKPAKPREHQRDAIRDVVKGFTKSGFTKSDRGQLIMACGTGKTLTSLFIKEKLDAERVLVLVPSLSLLKQTMQVWRVNARVPFEALPVCSDETVGRSAEDAAVAHTSELGVPVTTDPSDITAFLRRPGPRVVFSTYQSSPQIAEAFALGRVPAFHLVIADEAHRVAGVESPDFSTVLDATAIKARWRLFMTATPRYYTGRVLKAAQDADLEVASMDDPEKFGTVFHRLTFGAAIQRKLLTDYQVVVVGVDDGMYKEWAEKGTLVTRDGEKITDARTLAGQIGLAKTMRKYDLHRTISFHSRVARAREFAAEMPEVIAWMPARHRPKGTVWCSYASGEMTAGERHVRLQHLSRLDDGQRGLLSNARCLSEGVDVPTLDGVAFIDPRRSEVDIVQAVGRAIRKSEDKNVGTIVIPVFIDTNTDPETALDDSVFKPVWDVIQALRAHDGELGEQLDELRRQLGRQGLKPRLPGKIHLDLPTRVGLDFANAFNVRLVKQTTASWEFWFGLLEKYVAENGTARVRNFEIFDGHRLGGWVNNQRTRRSTLDPDRGRRLEELPGWSWAPHFEQWESSFALLGEYAAAQGSADVPKRLVVDGFPLGAWALYQRNLCARGELKSDRARRLEKLPGWRWERDLLAEAWEEGFRHLEKYVERHGNARVAPPYHTDGYSLGRWVGQQRAARQRGRLAKEYERRLERLPGWTWSIRQDQWELGIQRLKEFIGKHGHALIPAKLIVDGYRLGTWVNSQRTRYMEGSLEQDRIDRLEAVSGWSWDARAEMWDLGFQRLSEYVAQHGDARVPTPLVVDGFKLGQWVSVQRVNFNNGTLAADRKSRLEELPGWSWDVKTDLWEDGFRRLKQHVERNGQTLPKQSYADADGYRLGSWVTTQRQHHARGRLEPDRVRRLEALPGWSWNTWDTKWDEGFRRLSQYVEQHGKAQMPQGYQDEDKYRLGSWVTTQRTAYGKGTLSVERQCRLEELPGWSWEPGADAWEEHFVQVLDYVKKYGTSRVPQQYKVDGFRLGGWVQKQRNNFAEGKLSADRQRRLQELPEWRWSRWAAKTRPTRLTAESRAELRRLAATGRPVRELAAAFGIGRSTAHRLLASDS
jgi:superfamily II DNA or RNA helicase